MSSVLKRNTLKGHNQGEHPCFYPSRYPYQGQNFDRIKVFVYLLTVGRAPCKQRHVCTSFNSSLSCNLRIMGIISNMKGLKCKWVQQRLMVTQFRGNQQEFSPLPCSATNCRACVLAQGSGEPHELKQNHFLAV